MKKETCPFLAQRNEDVLKLRLHRKKLKTLFLQRCKR
jgi:hypothetical protein